MYTASLAGLLAIHLILFPFFPLRSLMHFTDSHPVLPTQ